VVLSLQPSTFTERKQDVDHQRDAEKERRNRRSSRLKTRFGSIAMRYKLAASLSSRSNLAPSSAMVMWRLRQ
jgi:hypothetical protein